MDNSFSEREYNSKFSGIKLQINEIQDVKEVPIILKTIKEYEIEYKFKQFSWIINEDISDLKRELEKRKKELTDEKKVLKLA